MRTTHILALVSAATAVFTGCASVFSLDQYTTADHPDANIANPTSEGVLPEAGDTTADAADEAALEPGCTTNAECTDLATMEGPLDAGVLEASADGATPAPFTGEIDGGAIPALCVQSVGKCARLLTPDCPVFYGDYTNDNSIVLGSFFVTSGTSGASNVSRQQAAILAASEINSSVAGGGLPATTPHGPTRPLLVVECDPSQNTVRTAQHLVNDLHVPAIVGPNAAQDVIDVTQQVSAMGGTLLMSPTALASPITYLVDDGLTFRDVPSDDQRAKLVIEQINEIETNLHATRGPTLKLGVVYRTDALGLSALDSISGSLIFNGHFLSDPSNASQVSLDHYDLANDVPSQTVIATHYASFLPDVVFVTAQEQVADVVIPLEQQLTMEGATTRPYYVCSDAAKTNAFLTASAASPPAGVPADFASRVRGIGVRPDGDSAPVFAAFNTAFTTRYGSNPGTSGMGSSYDAMYSVAFAIAAMPGVPVTGANVAKGLGSLGAGAAISVGQGQAAVALQTLAAGQSIALRGSYSAMLWDVHGDIVGGTAEVWCVGSGGGTPAFGSSGLTMDVASQVISGSYTQCP
jgi:branched-chain amino acid transport system substrate-binding protein